MNKHKGILQQLIEKAQKGSAGDIDDIMALLTQRASFTITRFVDFALDIVENDEGIQQIKHYLFHGSLIQRNYSSLYFNRRDEWAIVKKAFEQGLIDKIQAYSR